MNIEQYEALLKHQKITSPMDKKIEAQVEYIYDHVKNYQQSVEISEMKVYNEILAKFKNVNFDEIILNICRYGYTAYAIAYIGFKELKEEYLMLTAQEKLNEGKLIKFMIKNNTLLAVFDKTLLGGKDLIQEIFYNNSLKIMTSKVYVHPYFDTKSTDVEIPSVDIKSVDVKSVDDVLTKLKDTDISNMEDANNNLTVIEEEIIRKAQEQTL